MFNVSTLICMEVYAEVYLFIAIMIVPVTPKLQFYSQYFQTHHSVTQKQGQVGFRGIQPESDFLMEDGG
ncbi:hypothetical protein P4S64_20585 [Vibrio sp. M60_M31a]